MVDDSVEVAAALESAISGVEDETFHNNATQQEFKLFCDAVRALPKQCRRAFVLKKVYGYSLKEIAQELEISEKTVEKHIAEGIKRMHLIYATTNDVAYTAECLSKWWATQYGGCKERRP